ncbi:hypothetical protein SAY87_015411 [Trapa incisa]|uniref:Uncharacterized protein n=1 Tax=Trapa incisa TaxID=236973 RepID=A0AAN7JLZ0_9MYRT|nr:hypothetical protein SAY87_015411 [Trapa incisa]
MKLLLSKIGASRNWNSFLRIATVGAGGSGLLYANTDLDHKTRLWVSVHVPSPENHLLPCPPFASSNDWFLGNFSSFHFRSAPTPLPSDHVNAAVPANPGESGKQCSGGCLGRDTIANAAARVGPAVVNLSVPQGCCNFARWANL